MNRHEMEEFLQGKYIMRLATTDSRGDPVIQPTWYYYDHEKFYLMTGGATMKIRNIKRRNVVYFSVDTEIFPYKGVKGRGIAKLVANTDKAVEVVKQICIRYAGGTDTPMGRSYVDRTKSGSEVVVQITPEYFAVWDYGKQR